MTFADWQQLSPAEAAHRVHVHVREKLSPAQQRAAVSWLKPETELAAELSAAPSTAPLRGVPFFAKDLFDVGGVDTFAGSTFLPEVRPRRDVDGAFVTAVRASGAALAGKTHTHEFAYGITGENPNYGDCEHPRFPGRTTGGSSSGSAAVVAGGVVPFALGSDTGGSVRVPAAFCGLFGFRLTPRDAWIRDAFPLAPSFDTAGWFTVTAADMRSATQALVGLGRVEREPRGCYLEMPGVADEVAAAGRSAAARFARPADQETAAALLRGFAPALDTYQTIVAFDAWEAHRSWAERYRARYDPVVWQRLTRVHALTPAQRDAALESAGTIRAVWRSYFAQHDFLVLPASPLPALTKAECNLENRSRVIALTAPASVGGLPVLTIPVPLASGLTTGLQIIVNDVRSPAVRWVLEKC